MSALWGLGLFAAVALVLGALFWLFRPEYTHAAPIPATGGEATLIVEGGKEFDGIVTMLTTLTTGIFVLVALVARNPLRPTVRASTGQAVLLGIFAICAGGSFYSALHAKYALAEGLLAKSLDLGMIGSQIGMQAWFVAFSGAAAIALIIDALFTVNE